MSERLRLFFEAFLCVLTVGLALGIYIGKNQNSLNENIQEHRGWTDEFGDYTLRSFDAGQNWYAIDLECPEDEGTPCQVIILGPADEVYPGVLENALKMREDMARMKANPNNNHNVPTVHQKN